MTIGCLSEFLLDPSRLSITLISISLAVVIFLVLKKINFSTRSRIFLVYGHLTFLFFPVILYSTHIGCGMLCMPCHNNLFHLVSYALPTTLIASTLTGFVAIPLIYKFSSKKIMIESEWISNFIRKYSKKMNIKTPMLYAIDDAKPFAFSFRSFISTIFMSIGLMEILNKEEIKAVLLHEMSHIKQKSSILKFSGHILRFFSPLSLLAGFHNESSLEEKKADDFVVKMQGTGKYLLSAKKKLNEYEIIKKKTNL